MAGLVNGVACFALGMGTMYVADRLIKAEPNKESNAVSALTTQTPATEPATVSTSAAATTHAVESTPAADSQYRFPVHVWNAKLHGSFEKWHSDRCKEHARLRINEIEQDILRRTLGDVTLAQVERLVPRAMERLQPSIEDFASFGLRHGDARKTFRACHFHLVRLVKLRRNFPDELPSSPLPSSAALESSPFPAADGEGERWLDYGVENRKRQYVRVEEDDDEEVIPDRDTIHVKREPGIRASKRVKVEADHHLRLGVRY